MSQQGWAAWSPLSRRWGPPPWLCDACKRTLPGEAFTNRPHHPLHGESVCNDCQSPEWQRAALVWAFTEEGKPGPKKDLPTNGRISISDFAGMKISGLTKRDTVSKYRRAWSQAITDGVATDVRSGADYDQVERIFHLGAPLRTNPDQANRINFQLTALPL
ncbi:Uncharacterised protein [Mycobacteroides abscessus subsp. abscessus]|nr:Uncharacterised protein [Mycobacteroides abscessus subsp. abscessus]SHY41817.1 Uncharacterised protein [Mycobacteroides abscessus subsp. abscessus]SIC44269.1 Uncharacterised protein [Mycobacteroides abscessus subsp. abscessus]SIE67060.1 Uncharacterised protein [Mycobacteroides abscessus subsp. abscessus]SIG40106.1 Uncharacterised protein [Mycobacteroides abscessus subsp. abscessus]